MGVGAENNKIKVFLFSAEAIVRIIPSSFQVRGFGAVILEGSPRQHGVHCRIIYLSCLFGLKAFSSSWCAHDFRCLWSQNWIKNLIPPRLMQQSQIWEPRGFCLFFFFSPKLSSNHADRETWTRLSVQIIVNSSQIPFSLVPRRGRSHGLHGDLSAPLALPQQQQYPLLWKQEYREGGLCSWPWFSQQSCVSPPQATIAVPAL